MKKLSSLIFNKINLVIILFSLTYSIVHAQVDEDVKATKIKGKQSDKGDGEYSPYLFYNVEQPLTPLTTFSNEYPPDTIKTELKKKIQFPRTEYFDQEIYDIYKSIYKNALGYVTDSLQLYLPDDYDEPGQIDPNAQAAKYAAFVCLIGLDKDGQEINFGSPAYHQFKQVAFDALTMLKDNDYNKVYDGTGGKGYNTSRRIILFLQAYDYLKALEPQNDTVIDIGYLLQSHVNDYYKKNKGMPWDVFYRNDNHSLMFAGALGLASVVLHDHSYKKINKSWHPEQWAHAALWRINRTLWTESKGKKTESKKGGTYGFGEGYHYFGFSMIECVLPYMLALKNARNHFDLKKPKGGYNYKPKNLTLLPFYPDEFVYSNMWYDYNYENLFKWYTDALRPIGYVQMTDDSYPYMGYRGIGIYRNKAKLHYPEEAFSEENFSAQKIDVLVARLEGHFNMSKQTLKESFISDNGEVAIHTYVDRGVANQDNTNRQLLLHFNAKKEDFFKMYHRDFLGSPHGHYDLSSFTISAGIVNGASGSLATALVPEASGRVGTEKWYKKINVIQPDHHNVLLIDGKGPLIETPILVEKDLKDGLGTISYKFFYKKDIELIRQIKIFKEDGFITYEIKDELFGDELADRKISWQMYTNGHSNGNANSNNGEFKLEKIANGQFLVNANCATFSENNALFNLGVDLDSNFIDGNETIYLENATVGDEDKNKFAVQKIKFDVTNSTKFLLYTTLTPHYCGESVRLPVAVTISNSGGGGNERAVRQVNNKWKTLMTNQEQANNMTILNPFQFEHFGDSLKTNGNYSRMSIDTSRYDSLPCTPFAPLVQYHLENTSYLVIDTTEYYKSNDTVQSIKWSNSKKYYYTGNIETTNVNDTITFYLPEVPNPALSLMVEFNGLDYSYDTTTQKMTLYLPDSGSYKFNFTPSNPCAVSCFYPPDSINYHFVHQTTSERLGHILDVKTDSGWIDMQNGARMNICSKAVLNNLDSITLYSNYSCDDEDTFTRKPGEIRNIGYAAHYLSSENTAYRQNYRIGSGAGLSTDGITGSDEGTKPSRRTMIIVEDEGALVLKAGSHTIVGNGSTILVKPGGTLKIEDGAYLTIGSHDSLGCGYGEVIIMDSAFLCIGSDAHLSFYDKSNIAYDTTDTHIFYISKNPFKPAINGIAPTSNADTSGSCLQFCDLPTVFPTHGIANHRYGWLNVGTPIAELKAPTLICTGTKVCVDGLYSINETKFRFEVCKYDTLVQSCTDQVDTIEMNSLDNYFGGRLQGQICLSDYYTFEKGNFYRIRYKIKNDCGVQDSLDRIVEIPTALQANINADTVICSGLGALSIDPSNSTGNFDSLRWEVWAYNAFPEIDSAEYINNADTFISITDTFWLDSITIDTIVVDTMWFYKTDTIDNDSILFGQYYLQYWDTTIVSTMADSFTFNNTMFNAGEKYQVLLTLYNKCTVASDSIIIRVKDGPDVSAGPDKYIPYSTPSTPNPILEGEVSGSISYSWSPPTGLSSTSSLTPTASPSSTTNYALKATDADGCSNYDTVMVYVNTIANAGRDTTICSTDSIVVGRAASGSYTYLWSPSNLVSNPNIAQPYAYAIDDTNKLTLKVYDGASLVGIDELNIYKDEIDYVNFSINPAGGFYMANFAYSYIPNGVTNLTWNFDDGTGDHLYGTSNFDYNFPSVPSSIYYVKASFTNACGTHETTKDCEFDHIGNVIPKPGPLSIAEKVENLVEIWPNPVSNIGIIEYSLIENNNCYIEIADVSGKIIKTIKLKDNKGKAKIDLSDFSAGVYNYHLINGGSKLKTGKIVLVK